MTGKKGKEVDFPQLYLVVEKDEQNFLPPSRWENRKEKRTLGPLPWFCLPLDDDQNMVETRITSRIRSFSPSILPKALLRRRYSRS